MGAVVLLNAIVLAGVVASGAYFREAFAESGTELPQQTEIALGWIPPAILMCSLLMAISARYLLPARYQNQCELAQLGICCMIIVHHVIGIWLASYVGPVVLSQTPLALSACCG